MNITMSVYFEEGLSVGVVRFSDGAEHIRPLLHVPFERLATPIQPLSYYRTGVNRSLGSTSTSTSASR